MNRYLTTFVASLCLTAASGTITAAQEYVAPQVVVSTDKVRYNGKVYYSHIVQERQTLYSISKAYNVTLQEIYDANPNLHLNTEGLKKDQIILIPIKEGVTQTPTRTTKVETTADNKADVIAGGIADIIAWRQMMTMVYMGRLSICRLLP